MTLNDLKTKIISAFPEDAPPDNDTLYRLALLIDRQIFESYIAGARAYADAKFDPPCLAREIYDEWSQSIEARKKY